MTRSRTVPTFADLAASIDSLTKRHEATRAALIRLLWNSVADNATCDCYDGDHGPVCQAWQALYGVQHWPGAKKAQRRLGKEADDAA
jgi:hypothetical protein